MIESGDKRQPYAYTALLDDIIIDEGHSIVSRRKTWIFVVLFLNSRYKTTRSDEQTDL